MEFEEYIGLIVKIETPTGYYYKGKVISADSDSLVLLDINNKKVTLNKNSILIIKEAYN